MYHPARWKGSQSGAITKDSISNLMSYENSKLKSGAS